MHTKALTIRREANDHRTPTMKVDPNILSIHRGLLLFARASVAKPRVSTTTRNLHQERRPRSFIASVLRA
jgi:hypothetical protein